MNKISRHPNDSRLYVMFVKSRLSAGIMTKLYNVKL